MSNLVKVIVIAAVAWGAWNATGTLRNGKVGTVVSAPAGRDLSSDEMRALATTVEEGEVTMYTTSTCGYCAQAKSWLSGYGFAFRECNMTVSSDCEREFANYGADGTPFLIVRGRQMKNGFDSDEFVGILQQDRNDPGDT